MQNDSPLSSIVSTLPRAWEQEQTFNDSLYEWMSRAPWLLLSAAFHFVIALVIAAIPWTTLEQHEDVVVVADIEPPPEQIEEPEPEPEPDVVEPVEVQPTLEDFEVSDVAMDPLAESLEPAGDEGSADSPLDAPHTNESLGLTGGGGSKFGNRFEGGGGSKGRGPGAVPVARGLQWLADHQDEDGKWDADGFDKHDPAGDRTTGPGYAAHDVGVTGLALLAFLGDGHTMVRGRHRDTVVAGVRWLLAQQDSESGLLGEPLGHSFMYDHAIATIALCEACTLDRSPILLRRAKRAVHFITRARNPYRVWRYSPHPDDRNDTSVTGWMIFALRAAEDCGIAVDRQAYTAAVEWFDEMTDPATGRVGYETTGSTSSRIPGVNDEHPTEGNEALTAVTLLCRFFLGQSPDDESSSMNDHADLLLRSLPRWSDDGRSNDMYYWYYGSYAMFQMGNRRGGAKENYWTRWRKAMEPAVIGGQRQDGASKGSWDPSGPWGQIGGRVYSTATMVLSLEVYYRYARLLGAR